MSLRANRLPFGAAVLTGIEKVVPKNRALLSVGATRAKQRLIVLAHESLRGTLG